MTNRRRQKRELMKLYGTALGLLAPLMVICSTTALAHEECDDDTSKPAAVAKDPKQQTAANVTIKLFQYQPGRIEIKAGTQVTWVNEDEIFHTVTVEKSESGLRGSLEDRKSVV